jgi:hypothetical protein
MNTLTQYLEQYALTSLEKQDKLMHMVGEHLFQLDLDAGTVTFGDMELPYQVLGTESYNTLTWLWGWAEEQPEIPEDLVSTAQALKDWGAQAGIPEFTIPSVDIDKFDGHAFALIASEVCKASCFYQDAYEGGALFVLLFDKKIENQPPFDLTRLSKHFLDMVSRYTFNHRNMLLAYLGIKGITPLSHENRITCKLGTGETLQAEFDETGRILLLNGEAVEV